jgi:hypothetical protein
VGCHRNLFSTKWCATGALILASNMKLQLCVPLHSSHQNTYFLYFLFISILLMHSNFTHIPLLSIVITSIELLSLQGKNAEFVYF